MKRRALLLGGAASGLFAACSLDKAPRTDYYTLRDLDIDTPPVPAAQRVPQVLLLASGVAPALYDTDRLVYSADGMSRSNFQYAYWSDRPSRMLLGLAEQRLAASMGFRAVMLSTAGVRGDRLLTLRLDELYLDDSVSPGQMRLVFSAELIDWSQRQLLARRMFSHSVPVATRDAPGAALSASRALTALLGELQAWALRPPAG
jgi:ABC-type uncharacterized transport system auxiliary subunit